ARGRDRARVRAPRWDPPQIVPPLTLGVDDRLALGRPRWLLIKTAVGQLAHVRAVPVHDEDARLPRAVGDERELLAVRRPGGLGVDRAVTREALERAGRDREDVDLGIPVLRERERQELAVGAPRR